LSFPDPFGPSLIPSRRLSPILPTTSWNRNGCCWLLPNRYDSRFGIVADLIAPALAPPELVVEVTYLTRALDNLLRRLVYVGHGRTNLRAMFSELSPSQASSKPERVIFAIAIRREGSQRALCPFCHYAPTKEEDKSEE
jgi:hypothetical protein